MKRFHCIIARTEREKMDAQRVRRKVYVEEEALLPASTGVDGREIDALDLPRTLALFAARMGARFIGPPVYDAYFNVFALPLVATLVDIGPAPSRARLRSPALRPVF